MINKDLLDMLVCPESHQPLRLAEADLVKRINRAIERGHVKNAGGIKVERTVDGCLLRDDEQLLYPVLDEIPILLVDEAILLDQLNE